MGSSALPGAQGGGGEGIAGVGYRGPKLVPIGARADFYFYLLFRRRASMRLI